MAEGEAAPGPTQSFEVDLPVGGGKLHLLSAEEVTMWETAATNYRSDYGLTKTNDLVLLGALLTQQLAMFRAQQRINGMEPVLDSEGVPTGKYRVVTLKATELAAASETVRKAGKEIREIEQALGIDKKNREAGGTQTVQQYVTTLKRAGNEYGVHISKRTLAYERFCMALRTKLRILQNADEEDKAYEGVSGEAILNWSRDGLAKLEEVDKEFAKEKGRLVVGKL